MDISWYGQSMFKLKGKAGTAVIDPFDPQFIGLKFPKDLEAQVVLSTHRHGDHSNTKEIAGHPLVVDGPGEYEVSGITVVGIQTFHDKSEGSERGKNTIYSLSMDGLNIVHLGDLGHVLTEEQAGLINTEVDILMVPVGGVFTIDAEDAAKVVAQLEPKIVIPMHYKLPELKVEIEGVESFLKEMGAEAIAPVPKLTITKDKLPDETTVVLLSKS